MTLLPRGLGGRASFLPRPRVLAVPAQGSLQSSLSITGGAWVAQWTDFKESQTSRICRHWGLGVLGPSVRVAGLLPASGTSVRLVAGRGGGASRLPPRPRQRGRRVPASDTSSPANGGLRAYATCPAGLVQSCWAPGGVQGP